MDARQIVERHWPYDGPHTNDRVAAAAEGIERLTRYMANATYQPVTSGPALYRTLSSLNDALYHLDQALRQVADSTSTVLADDPTLFDDRHDRPAEDTAVDVADAISEARQGIAGRLQRAAQMASHLGHGSNGGGE